MKIIYTAGRFRGETPWDVHCNVHAASLAALEVAECGAMPLCPHANTAHFDGLFDAQFWIEGTKELLRRSDALYVFDPGWKDSSGTVGEITLAIERRIPIFPPEHGVYLMRRWLRDDYYEHPFPVDSHPTLDEMARYVR